MAHTIKLDEQATEIINNAVAGDEINLYGAFYYNDEGELEISITEEEGEDEVSSLIDVVALSDKEATLNAVRHESEIKLKELFYDIEMNLAAKIKEVEHDYGITLTKEAADWATLYVMGDGRYTINVFKQGDRTVIVMMSRRFEKITVQVVDTEDWNELHEEMKDRLTQDTMNSFGSFAMIEDRFFTEEY